jgi:hypothetical protein
MSGNCTNKQNCQNRQVIKGNSKYLGVHLKTWKWKNDKGEHMNQKYCAQIQINGKRTNLGIFPNTPEGEVSAAMCYDYHAMIHYGEYANLNFKIPDAA